MSGVFRNIDPPPPASVYPRSLVRGKDTLARGRGGRGSIVRKTPDIALYSIYVSTLWACTDIKENQIFLIYREIQSGAVAKSYMRRGFLIYEEIKKMRKYFPIYEEAVSHI
jgi:hypothetical protein